MNISEQSRINCILTLLIVLTMAGGCSDYGIKDGDSPQIIALKKLGAKVTTLMTGGQAIDLKDTGVDDDDLIHFEELPTAFSINLAGTNVTNAGLSHLTAGPKNLSELFLDETEVTDDGITALKELGRLSYLSLSGTKVTDATLSLLPVNHPRLHDLDLSGCDQITNDGLKSVAELRGLQKLILQNCQQITDEGLEHLMKMRGMQVIQLLNTGCTSAGVEKLAKSTGAPFVVNSEGLPAGPMGKFIRN